VYDKKPSYGTLVNYGHHLAGHVDANYLFNERSGSRLVDSFPNNLNGINNGATWVANGLDFNGSSDWVQLPDISLGETGFDITYIAIIRPDGLVGNVDIISQQGTDQMPNTYIRLQTRGTELGAFIRDNAATPITLTGSGLTVGVEYHTALIKRGTVWTLYLNGVVDAVDTLVDDFTLNAAAIGSFSDGASNFFNGVVKNVVLCNCAWTQEQIVSHMIDPYAMFRHALNPSLFGAFSRVIIPRRRIEGY